MTCELQINVHGKHTRMTVKDSSCEMTLRSGKNSRNTDRVVDPAVYH